MQDWLAAIPPSGVYLALFLVVGLEFLCLPLPGGLALITAGLLAVRGHVDPWLVITSTVAGVIIGSILGYHIGRRGGQPLLNRLSNRFSRTLSPKNVARATTAFSRWGAWGVLAGCFSAVLRMLAAPLSGMLTLRFWPFLAAITTSAILWAGGTTAAVYSVGLVAQAWLDALSLATLAMLAVVGVLAIFSRWRRSRKPTL
jgi:membrane protein DedA with SNARE-associated domain